MIEITSYYKDSAVIQNAHRHAETAPVTYINISQRFRQTDVREQSAYLQIKWWHIFIMQICTVGLC